MVASGILAYFNFVTPFTKSLKKNLLNSLGFVKFFVMFHSAPSTHPYKLQFILHSFK
jgi:hypothetical protein